MNEASLNQIAAADPARSTWLTANAGSGKTRVLTDRVARLLLELRWDLRRDWDLGLRN